MKLVDINHIIKNGYQFHKLKKKLFSKKTRILINLMLEKEKNYKEIIKKFQKIFKKIELRFNFIIFQF